MEGSNDTYSGDDTADDVDLMEHCSHTMVDTRPSLPPTYTDAVGSETSAMVEFRDHHSDLSGASPEEVSLPTEGSSQTTEEVSLPTEGSSNTTEEVSLPTQNGDSSTSPLEYRISDNPPIHLTVVFAFQQALLAFATQLIISLLVAQVVDGEHDPEFRGVLLGSTMFMCGLTTFVMALFGVRLPMLQGAASEYIVPLLVLQDTKQDKCDVTMTTGTTSITSTGAYVDVTGRLFNSNNSTDILMSNVTTLADGVTAHDYQTADYDKLQGMMGSLMVAGTVHFLMGATGLVGILLRFVGPITVVPTLLLVGFRMALMVTDLIAVHWGIGIMTSAIAVILSLYLGGWKMPLPFWTRSEGFHILRSTFHQTAGILIALLSGWTLCGILTQYGAFSDDPKAPDFYARTDFMPGVIQNARWIYLPYPGQFGMPSFSVRAMIGFLIATLISILDSIGDYYACAVACNVPPPPVHAVNRGIALEGLCSFLSGTLGCGHATGTYGGNIGVIRITKVASRRVFLMVGVLFMLFGIVGKLCALFIIIPYPVLGGAMLIMTSMFTGVAFANLQHVDLRSNRNLAIIGISVSFGLIVPSWIEKHPDRTNTGNEALDQLVDMLLGNPILSGALLACLLDNTIAGSRMERGLTAWEDVTSNVSAKPDDVKEEMTDTEGIEIYEPVVPRCVRGWKGFRYIPFMPDKFSYTQIGTDKKESV